MLVLFHRKFRRLPTAGGHLKVFHYFEHVRRSPPHEARIRFTADSVWDESNPWLHLREYVVAADAEIRADVLFLGAVDWSWLSPEERAHSRLPIINLIQLPPGPNPEGWLNRDLANPAIRICVTSEVQERLELDGSAQGPIFTVPIGLDLERLPPAPPRAERPCDCLVLAVKDPPLGRWVAQRLSAARYRVRLIDRPVPREELLAAMAGARVAVLLPATVEGAYLPALECMALSTAVVCPDCVGNRSFCRDGDTCIVPKRSKRAIVKAAQTLLNASEEELAPMIERARQASSRHTLEAERAGFLEILEQANDLWAGVRS